MKVTRKRAVVGLLLLSVAGAFALKFVLRPIIATCLRANATVYRLEKPSGGRLSIAIHRYPRLGHWPEYLGFGEGYVQLFDSARGTVFQDVPVNDLAGLNSSAWGSLAVKIGDIEWQFPEGYEYRSPEAFLDLSPAAEEKTRVTGNR